MTKEHLQSEIRYAIRLTERTARLYRKVQIAGYVLTIVGGSAVLGAIGSTLPSSVTLLGASVFTVAGALLIAIRPADKVAQNDTDARRYQTLMVKSVTMDAASLAQALEEARQSHNPEVEPLRDVAYNDVALECDRPDIMVPLSCRQRVLEKLA